MAIDERTYKVDQPRMTGGAIDNWQKRLNGMMKRWEIEYRIEEHGIYGVETRDLSRKVVFGLGIDLRQLDQGVTREMRIKVKDIDLSDLERKRFHSKRRKEFRKRLKDKHAGGGVCSPLVKITASSNGFTSIHDGVDLICPADAPGFAICKAKVVRADKDGWWGLGAPADPVLRAKGDGIVIIRSLVDIGPIKKGMNLCYGHAEKPRVKVGDIVHAGQRICDAGFANAWHFHFMINHNPNTRGVGDRDPMPIVKYAIAHA